MRATVAAGGSSERVGAARPEPLVTIVTPTYNRLPLLREAIASIARQTYARWELIVVDDGSTDGTADDVRKLHDVRIRVLSLPHCGHLGLLRNAGAAAGSGELIAFLDSDDVWLPGKLAAQVRALQGSGAKWCYTGFEMMDHVCHSIPMRWGVYRPLSGWIARDLLTMRTGVMIDSLLVARDLFESAGRFSENPQLLFRGDLEFALRLALHAPAVALAETFVRVREHAGRSTARVPDPSERTAMAYTLFIAHQPPDDLLRIARRCRGELLADAARARIRRGEIGVAARHLTRAFLDGAGARRVIAAAAGGVLTRRRSTAPRATSVEAVAAPRPDGPKA